MHFRDCNLLGGPAALQWLDAPDSFERINEQIFCRDAWRSDWGCIAIHGRIADLEILLRHFSAGHVSDQR